jgi:hypothetical protein
MATHTFVLLVRVTAKQYTDASRQLRDGSLNTSPLALALIEQGTYKLSGHIAKRITLMDIATGRRYSGSMPAGLTKYLAGFRRGVRVVEDHEFELVLVSDEE